MPPMASVELNGLANKSLNTGELYRYSYTQAFPNPEKTKAERKYLSSFSEINVHEADYTKVGLFAIAKENFYNIFIAKKKIGYLNENIHLIEIMIGLAEKQMAITKGDLSSVYRLKAKLATNEAMIVHETFALKTYQTVLNYLMNEDVNNNLELDTNALLKNYEGYSILNKLDSIETWRSDLKKINSEIANMKFNQNFMALQRKPIFSVTGAISEMTDGGLKMGSIMGSVTIPSFKYSARMYQSQVRSMDFTIAGMEQEKQDNINMAKQSIAAYQIELESEQKEVSYYQKQVIPNFKKSLDAGLLAYGQNTSDMNMILLSWDDLQQAQLEYLTHLDTYLKMQTAYEKELQIR
jgi:outer membrane protein TolC